MLDSLETETSWKTTFMRDPAIHKPPVDGELSAGSFHSVQAVAHSRGPYPANQRKRTNNISKRHSPKQVAAELYAWWLTCTTAWLINCLPWNSLSWSSSTSCNNNCSSLCPAQWLVPKKNKSPSQLFLLLLFLLRCRSPMLLCQGCSRLMHLPSKQRDSGPERMSFTWYIVLQGSSKEIRRTRGDV